MLNVPAESDRKTILKKIKDHIIAEAVLTGTYEKEKIKSGH
jgi:phosphatidylethanolamine-binding protein (PEBP) family uncharacterized protein